MSVNKPGMAASGPNYTAVVTEEHELLVATNGGPLRAAALDDSNLQIVMVVVSFEHFAAVTLDGGVVVSGINTGGLLGIDASADASVVPLTRVPPALFNGARIIQLAVGSMHTVALTDTGGVYTTGSGYHGQLGLGTRRDVSVFTRVAALAEVVFIAAGAGGSAAISRQLYTWGNNRHGELGVGDREARLLPVVVPVGEAAAPVDEAAAPVGEAAAPVGEAAAPPVYVSMGQHTAVVLENDKMWVWGSNQHGQLALGDRVERVLPCEVDVGAVGGRVVSVVCGTRNTLVLARGGAVFWCGSAATSDDVRAEDRLVLQRIPDLPQAVSLMTGRGVRFGAVTTEGTLYDWHARTTAPTPMLRQLDVRAGLFNPLLPEHALAFAMLRHARLGAGSVCAVVPDDVFRGIVEACASRPTGPVGALDGVRRLLGGA